MGKRNANLSGLARFVTEAFGSPGQSTRPTTPPPAHVDYKDASREAHAEDVEPRTTPSASEVMNDTGGDTARPKKRRKVSNFLGSGKGRYDATGLVPFYQKASEVPVHLQKYFAQRERYFSLYSSGCLLDEEGWYSVTPERIANQIAERCRCDVVLDAFCGVGGNAIAFAKTCERVIALDISPVRLALARHNAAIYGVEDRIEFVLADFFSFARALQSLRESGSTSHQKIDVVFLSPPWGGPSYLTDRPGDQQERDTANGVTEQTPPEFSLSAIRPVHGKELFKIARSITRNVAYFLPRNVKLEEVSALNATSSGEEDDYVPAQRQPRKGKEKAEMEMVEVEEEWMGNKLKALTCYFGGLVSGQEHSFEL